MTAYGGELQYTVRFSPSQRPLKIGGQPDVVLQGNGIFLEHYSETRPTAHTPQTVSVTFREVRFVRLSLCLGEAAAVTLPPVDSRPGGVPTDRRARGSTC